MRARHVLAALAAVQVVRCWRLEGARYVIHNLIGHPALVLAAGRVGETVHAETIPEDD